MVWASPVGWIYIQIHRTACFVAATPVCLHEELERMCSCQLSASASRQKEGSVVSPLILKLWIGSWHYPVWLRWTEELLLEFICILWSCYYTVCAWLVLIMKMKVNQQSLLQTSFNSERYVLKYLTTLCGFFHRLIEKKKKCFPTPGMVSATKGYLILLPRLKERRKPFRLLWRIRLLHLSSSYKQYIQSELWTSETS